ncbi:LSM domain-containing protein [Fusarium phyllophilum]|uniref:LSM domain-containing protein n=1 Tax=Fusarium phyllophilum TaxID=47803 RepID=A0A8H5NME4_9HYPO|nr:LSM domain-containing protein [Fusarium phyllophilum]
MDTEKARQYLSSILNKNLRVYTSDGRLFWGALKCTDPPSSRDREKAAEKSDGETVKVDMTSRYLGLVVIPGEHIAKMEVEEFASQMRN